MLQTDYNATICIIIEKGEKIRFMNLIKPKKLHQGDTIGILSVSGSIKDISFVENSALYFQKKGFKTIISDNTYNSFRYHAGSDNQRIKALEDFFSNENIDAIVCSRGGYGALRIINDIDYSIIAKNPKIFCGYSDITTLLLMIYKKPGMVSFHGAMTNGDFGGKISSFTEKSFFDTLQSTDILYYSAKNNFKVLNKGTSNGVLWGGNLATIVSMIGLDFLPDENFIFFLEDINEPAYKIDRMLTQLFNCEKFAKNISGIVVGEFSGIDKINYVYDVLMEFVKKYNIPCCDGFKISHEKDKITLPIGLKCDFSADEGVVNLLETAFID